MARPRRGHRGNDQPPRRPARAPRRMRRGQPRVHPRELPFQAGRYAEAALQIGGRQPHRGRGHALPLRGHALPFHAGGLPHGLPLLRLHAQRPRARPHGWGDAGAGAGGEPHARPGGPARAQHRAHGQRRTAGQLRKHGKVFASGQFPGAHEHLPAQHIALHLRARAADARSCQRGPAGDALHLPARPQRRGAQTASARGQRLRHRGRAFRRPRICRKDRPPRHF